MGREIDSRFSEQRCASDGATCAHRSPRPASRASGGCLQTWLRTVNHKTAGERLPKGRSGSAWLISHPRFRKALIKALNRSGSDALISAAVRSKSSSDTPTFFAIVMIFPAFDKCETLTSVPTASRPQRIKPTSTMKEYNANHRMSYQTSSAATGVTARKMPSFKGTLSPSPIDIAAARADSPLDRTRPPDRRPPDPPAIH